MIRALPMQRWVTFGGNTGAQNRRNAGDPHPVRKCFLLGTLELSKSRSTADHFVCLSCHVFVFEEARPNYFFFL